MTNTQLEALEEKVIPDVFAEAGKPLSQSIISWLFLLVVVEAALRQE